MHKTPHRMVHLLFCHVPVAAWPSSRHKQALHSGCSSLIWVSLLQTLPGNTAITEMAHSALEPVASDNKLPKALLSASLKPILVHLAYHNKLKLPLLKGLGRLLQLLSSWFNLALGGHGCNEPSGAVMFCLGLPALAEAVPSMHTQPLLHSKTPENGPLLWCLTCIMQYLMKFCPVLGPATTESWIAK